VAERDLTELLFCPVRHEGLRASTKGELVAARRWLCRDSELAADASGLDAGYTSIDGKRLYPVRDGIIFLLPQSAIPLDGPSEMPTDDLHEEKRRVQEFYDEFGWQEGDDGKFGDTRYFVDDSPLSREYLRRCNLRVKEHLPRSGAYLLDAGSGAIPLPEYLTYSDSFERRLCVDLSVAALRQAQRKLGPKGVYVLGDITNLPLREGSVDGVVSLHILYHVPQEEQLKALTELHRVLAPGRTAVIVYSWGNRALGPWLRGIPRRTWNLARTSIGRATRPFRQRKGTAKKTPPGGPSLYFHAHPRGYLSGALRELGIEMDVFSFQSVSKGFTERWVRPWLLGGPLVSGLYACESRFPRLMGRLGQYPLFVIRK
jgi:SAM-dependent methyltransferase/uncharacterized protein YbaR (Trm112 family)